MELSGPALAGGNSVRDGQVVYDRVCYKCHRSGTLGAPQAGNKKAWEPRLQTGIVNLYQSALRGKNDMPPRGGREDLTDDQVVAAVNYLLKLAGLLAEEPKADVVAPPVK
jgi:cytochrome c5